MVKSLRYAGAHQAIRAATIAEAYGTACTRCGRLMLEGQELDLDHNDDGRGYRGFSHAKCNRRAGGIRSQQLRAARRRERNRIMLTTFAIGVAISEDRTKSALGMAGWLEGDVLGVELAAYLDGPHAVVDEVLRLRAEPANTVVAVALDPRSQASTLRAPLTAAGVDLVELGTGDIVAAHGEFVDAVRSRLLRAVPHPALDAAARAGNDRPLAGARAWERRGQTADISPLDAVTVAAWALRHAPRAKPFFASVRMR